MDVILWILGVGVSRRFFPYKVVVRAQHLIEITVRLDQAILTLTADRRDVRPKLGASAVSSCSSEPSRQPAGDQSPPPRCRCSGQIYLSAQPRPPQCNIRFSVRVSTRLRPLTVPEWILVCSH